MTKYRVKLKIVEAGHDDITSFERTYDHLEVAMSIFNVGKEAMDEEDCRL